MRTMTRVNQSKPRICLISNSWNEAAQLPELFESVAKQTLLPAIWLFIDDGSTDETPRVLEDLVVKHPQLNVRIISMPRKEKGNLDTLGIVIKKALRTLTEHYDYYVKLDVDTRMPPHYFEEITKRFEQDPKLMVASGVLVVNGKPEPNRRKFARGSGIVIRGWFFERFISDIPDVTIEAWINTKARFHGYKTRQFDDLVLIQTRPTTQLTARGSFRNGRLSYYFNYNFIIVLAKALAYALLRKNGSAILKGYWYTWHQGWKIKDPEIKFYYSRYIFVDYAKLVVERIREQITR